MVKSIVLDKYTGETLQGDGGLKEINELKPGPDFFIGIHAVCGGHVRIRPISTTHKAIFCHSCCMRFLVPASVETYGDLRSFFNTKNSGVLPGP